MGLLTAITNYLNKTFKTDQPEFSGHAYSIDCVEGLIIDISTSVFTEQYIIILAADMLRDMFDGIGLDATTCNVRLLNMNTIRIQLRHVMSKKDIEAILGLLILKYGTSIYDATTNIL